METKGSDCVMGSYGGGVVVRVAMLAQKKVLPARHFFMPHSSAKECTLHRAVQNERSF